MKRESPPSFHPFPGWGRRKEGAGQIQGSLGLQPGRPAREQREAAGLCPSRKEGGSAGWRAGSGGSPSRTPLRAMTYYHHQWPILSLF